MQLVLPNMNLAPSSLATKPKANDEQTDDVLHRNIPNGVSCSYPKVGIAVFIRRRGKILLGKRAGTRGYGCWSTPGGHLEPTETFKQCAEREAFEEAGVYLQNLSLCTVTNDVFLNENSHYVTVILVADYRAGKVELREPDAFQQWRWFEWNSLPHPRVQYLETLRVLGFDPFSHVPRQLELL